MNLEATIVYTDTADANAAIARPCLVHAVQIYNATSTNTPLVELHDATTVTGTPKITVAVDNTYDATHFEISKTVTFPAPVRFEKAVSVNITGTGLYKIFASPL